MAEWQKGYRTITTAETAADASLSVRYVRDIEESINATIVAMSPKLVSDASPSASAISAEGVTTECVVRVYGPFVVAQCYDALSVTIGHVRRTGADSTVWRLYCGPQIYAGPAVLAASGLGASYDSATIATTSSDTHAISVSKRVITIRRGIGDGLVWLTLTAQNGDADTRAAYTTVDVSAQRRGAYA